MKSYNIYKLVVDSCVVVPNAEVYQKTLFVVAENEQDAKDSFDVSITGVMGVTSTVISCEFVAPLEFIVDDKLKKYWRR